MRYNANSGHQKKVGGVMAAGTHDLRLVLIGNTRVGKSASGNTILGQRHFRSQLSARSVTRVCEVGSVELPMQAGAERRRVTVVDLPGFSDTDLTPEQIHTEVAKCVCLAAPGPHAFLLVVPIGGYTDQEDQAVRQMTRIFGEAALRHHTVLLFTRGDDLEGLGLEEYLRTAPAALRALIHRCGRRYHVFNNRDPGNAAQVTELLVKVDAMVEKANPGFYTNRMFEEAEAALREEEGRRSSRGASRGRDDISVQRPTSQRSQPSDKVLQKIKSMVAAGATGFALGALFGVAVPLATAGSAYVVGNSVGFVAGKVAGASVAASCSEAVGAVVAVAAGKTALATGAVAGGVVGGTVGVMIGTDAASPGEAAMETLDQVSDLGVMAVGAGLAFGATLGAGAALSAALGPAAVNSTAPPAPPPSPAPSPSPAPPPNQAPLPCPGTGPGSNQAPDVVNNIIINLNGTEIQAKKFKDTFVSLSPHARLSL